MLANGDVLEIRRGEVTASPDGLFEIELSSGRVVIVPVPTYRMPDVAKLSAGYFARPGMDLIDLFIGSEGTLGIVIEATLRVIPRPRRAVALIRCDDEAQAVAVTAALRRDARRAGTGGDRSTCRRSNTWTRGRCGPSPTRRSHAPTCPGRPASR